MNNKHIGQNFDDFLKEEGIMTTDLEKQFFDTFGIEPIEQEVFVLKRMVVKEYPQFTDRLLLNLICLNPLSIEFKYPKNINELKNTLIKYYIEYLSLYAEPSEAEIFKHQVQALFKEG